MADMVVSYATVPGYSLNNSKALAETMRILKYGRMALFAPMTEYCFEDWQATIDETARNGLLSAHYSSEVTINGADDYPIDVYFTCVRK